jgi:hypothetical protein
VLIIAGLGGPEEAWQFQMRAHHRDHAEVNGLSLCYAHPTRFERVARLAETPRRTLTKQPTIHQPTTIPTTNSPEAVTHAA